MTGTMVRMMRFQCSSSEMGITGWMFTLYCMAWLGPMPKSQLFWKGTLIRFATGFWSFLARSASSLPEPVEALSAVSLLVEIALELSLDGGPASAAEAANAKANAMATHD